jgi:hypothetical protein
MQLLVMMALGLYLLSEGTKYKNNHEFQKRREIRNAVEDDFIRVYDNATELNNRIEKLEERLRYYED